MPRRENETFTFLTGLILGVVASAPVVAWLSPRSGSEVRAGLVQRGRIVRRRVGQAVRRPAQQLQDQVQQLRGASIEEALDEGRAIAARRQAERNG